MLGTAGTSSRYAAMAEEDLDGEIESLERALGERGSIEQAELERAVQGERWGPGRFDGALREAVEEGRARRLSHRRYGAAQGDGRPRREATPSWR
jgi:hypothetical protein